ncbi:MAG: MerR family transcriptional regulator [Oscillospiraceae bacterium]|nr:MerR family transcriptional regulator [Oscillospiraceae bacterium]
MKTVKEVSHLTGVSVRTLHHYDAIGLLKPTQVTQAGYRLYDDAALGRLQTILLFRELEFPLKDIKAMLSASDFDPMAALSDQIRLLELRREQLDRLIDHARQIQKTGVMNMDFKAYDTKKLDAYAAEAKQRWGRTDAWKESQEKAKGKTREEQAAEADGLMDIFRRLGQLRQGDPASPEAQALIAELQQYICDHYYNCTNQILFGLGQMYAAGDEMNENIDRAGGAGTGDFARRAIEAYCK